MERRQAIVNLVSMARILQREVVLVGNPTAAVHVGRAIDALEDQARHIVEEELRMGDFDAQPSKVYLDV